MESLAEKMFEFQRKATQTVLQKMGAVDSSVDEHFDNTFNNFKRLGEFLTHLEEQTKTSLNTMEKMCYNNSALASSLCNFVLSEMSTEDSEYSTGLLSKFFLKSSASPNLSQSDIQAEASNRKSKFQDSVQRLYDSFGTIGHENMKGAIDGMDYQVLSPIKKDQDFNKVTKMLVDKKKKAQFDYDSVKRSNDAEKVRQCKEESDMISKKTISHLQNRSFIRCKLIVHSVITMIQQFCTFFESNSVLLEGLLQSIEPLLETYQLSADQVSDLYTLKKSSTSTSNNNNTSSSNNGNHVNINSTKPTTNTSSSTNGGSIPTSPPPTYNEHVSTSGNNSFFNQFQSMNMNSPDSSSPTSSSSGGADSPVYGSNTVYPKDQQKQQEKLFSVWDEDDKSSSTSSDSKEKPKKSEDDWMYHSSTPQRSTAETMWDDPIRPQSTPTTGSTQQQAFNNHFRDFNSGSPTPNKQQQGFNNMHSSSQDWMKTPQQQQQQQQQPQQKPFSQSQPNLFNNMNNNNSNNNNNNNFNVPPPNTPNSNTTTNTPKQPTGYENMFGDFDFTPPPNSKQPHGNTTTATNSSGNASFNYFMPQQPTPHVDDHQQVRAAIEPQVSERIKKWSEKNGRKNNIRILLSTLHEVLWEGSGWEKIGYGAMVKPIDVKKVYRKACLVVHPDKVNNGSVEQKMIAQRIFEGLRESFEVFKVDLEPSN